MTDACTDAAAETRLNEYLDGELRAAEQPLLFQHLAGCAACRADFEALLAFRLAVRADALAVPPAADAALFARLDRRRQLAARRRSPDRRAERHLLGGALRHRVSLGAALVVALVAVTVGLMTAPPPRPAPAPRPQSVQVMDASGPLFVSSRPVAVLAERER